MTQRVFIVVKGQEVDAVNAATREGIELSILGTSSNGREVYCEAPMTERAKVIAWYSRDAGWNGEFELGSCLWYAYRD